MKLFKKAKLNSKGFGHVELVVAVVVIAVISVVGVRVLIGSHAASDNELYLSPSATTVAVGSNINIDVTLTASSAKINTIQSVLTYNDKDFSFVGARPLSPFNTFPFSTKLGSINFTEADSHGGIKVGSNQAVAVIELHAIGDGVSDVKLASVCPSGDFKLNCSAVWDAVTSDNDLGSVAGAVYTVVAPTLTAPSKLTASAINATGVTLTWKAGDAAVEYYIYQDGVKVGSTTTTSYSVTGLSASTSYSYFVVALDKSGNSVRSTILVVDTP